jgi:flagellar basal-body rod protein FlgF
VHMDPGLYIAASGMLAEQVQQGQLSNDLANASTPGYKTQASEQQSFGAMLLANTATGQPIGTIDTRVTAGKTVTDTTPMPLQSTGQPLDFGIAGDGYFAVKTAQGVRYTRDGQFASNAAGQLVDQNGDQVLGQNGQPIKVSAQGTLSASALGVFTVNNVTQQGNTLYSGAASGKASGVVHGGELEESGVDAIQTMTDMIASLRAYQAGQSAIQSIDRTMQEDASSVPSLGGGG